MGNTIQLMLYQRQYGKKNIYKIKLENDNFYMPVHHINKGRIKQDMDDGNCFIWKNNLIWTNRN